MARLPRVVAVEVPHHVTQRGNSRRYVLESESDRLVYLQLLQRHCQMYCLDLLGYCLMSNHVHLIAVPRKSDSLAAALKYAHGQYAAYFNARHAVSGHVWQGRYYSCPLDLSHLWAALRYTELNPVRAGLTQEPESYPWSSAAVHCGHYVESPLLDMTPWRDTWTSSLWHEYLAAEGARADADAIRLNTHTGRPLGAPEFVDHLEKILQRRLTPCKGGRPSRQRIHSQPETFAL